MTARSWAAGAATVAGMAALMAGAGPAGAVTGVNCAGDVPVLDGTTLCNTFAGGVLSPTSEGGYVEVDPTTGEIKMFGATETPFSSDFGDIFQGADQTDPLGFGLTYGQVLSGLTSEVITLTNEDVANPSTTTFVLNVEGSIMGPLSSASALSAGIVITEDLTSDSLDPLALSLDATARFGIVGLSLKEPALAPTVVAVSIGEGDTVTVPAEGDPGLAADGFDFDISFDYELAPGETKDLRLTFGTSLLLATDGGKDCTFFCFPDLERVAETPQEGPVEGGFAVADLANTTTATILRQQSTTIETEQFANVVTVEEMRPVPLPAGGWLLLAGLGLLAAARRS